MRVLLDEHLPVRLSDALGDHEVSTVRGSIEHQLNVTKIRLGIVILDAPTNKYEDLLPLMPATLDAIASVSPGEVRDLAG